MCYFQRPFAGLDDRFLSAGDCACHVDAFYFFRDLCCRICHRISECAKRQLLIKKSHLLPAFWSISTKPIFHSEAKHYSICGYG